MWCVQESASFKVFYFHLIIIRFHVYHKILKRRGITINLYYGNHDLSHCINF